MDKEKQGIQLSYCNDSKPPELIQELLDKLKTTLMFDFTDVNDPTKDFIPIVDLKYRSRKAIDIESFYTRNNFLDVVMNRSIIVSLIGITERHMPEVNGFVVLSAGRDMDTKLEEVKYIKIGD